MNEEKPTRSPAIAGGWTLAVIGFGLLYLAISLYTHAVLMKDQELAAFLVSVYIVTGGYTGYYTAQSWTTKPVPNGLFLSLLAILVASLLGLFGLADWYYGHRSIWVGLLLALPVGLMGLITGGLVKLVQVQVNYRVGVAQQQAQQSQLELHLLQSQVSPHFLFNTLNNLYGLSLLRPQLVPPLLLKLSELLRYSVYEANQVWVPLSSETAYLSHYIEFERLRLGERLLLQTNLATTGLESLRIAPMLLLVFVENAFKHAKTTHDTQIRIQIELSVEDKQLAFWVKNSHAQPAADQRPLDAYSGLGLANVQQRLELLYPNAYQLSRQQAEYEYST